MVFQTHIPEPPLADYVDCIAYVEGNNKGTGFPKSAMSVVFNLDDSFKLYTDDKFDNFTDYNKYWISGLQTGPSYVESYGRSRMIVIQFKTFGAWRFLREPLRNFSNAYVDLELVVNREAKDTWERLQETQNIPSKFLVIEKFLMNRMALSQDRAPGMMLALAQTFQHRPVPAVSEICRDYRVSRKHLNHLFHEYFGVSPKMLTSLTRFQKILQSISHAKPARLTQLAYELDFFDQAHFSNNFKHYTGLSPNEYIRQMVSHPSLKYMPHFLPAAW